MVPDLFPSSHRCSLNAPALANTSPKERQYGRYLYRRRSLYYFRYTFPEDTQAKLGHRGICLSLRTGYLREAKHAASILAAALKRALPSGRMLSYKEIRARLHSLLQDLLMRDAQQLGSRAISFPELELEITPAELCRQEAVPFFGTDRASPHLIMLR